MHFFEDTIVSDEDIPGAVDSYLGSIVLRPTEVATLGRTLLSPKAVKGFKGYICQTEFENNLNGVSLKVKTFPHIMQDTDVTICAHAVCWMIARYYSERYTLYPERLTFDIATAVTDVSSGRTIPSRGITLGQVSEILTSVGFQTEVFVRDLYEDTSFFYDILYSYVESGIPVVAAMNGKEHAVAIIGHGPVQSAVTTANATNPPPEFLNARHCSQSLVINNDNCLPFHYLAANDQIQTNYKLNDVDGFVVPLYEKMYLAADNVLKIYPKWVTGNLVKLKRTLTYITRVFMTSSKSYKRSVAASKSMDPVFREAQLDLPLPKFIWIVELAEPSVYDKKQVNYRWILDATANSYEKYPFLLIHDDEKMIINDRAYSDKIYNIQLPNGIVPFDLFENNLGRYL
jgi:hypothetical protein